MLKEMNKSGVWKSLEVKQNEDGRKSSKDDTPDEGLTLKVNIILNIFLNNLDIMKYRLKKRKIKKNLVMLKKENL